MLDKLRNDKLISDWKTSLIMGLLALMLTGLFFSRFLLSAGMIGFILVCFLHTDLPGHIKKFFSTPLLWGMSLLFFVPLISGIWSENREQWWDIMKIKAPLFFLPLAFAGPVQLTKKLWEYIAYFFIALLLGSTIWTMLIYLSDTTTVNASYLQAKTMTTPLENDHVRYSWLISIGVLVSICFFLGYGKKNRNISFLWLVTGIWFLIFLHVISARTGLLSVYLMGLVTIVWLSFRKTNWKTVLLLLVVIVSLPFIAYQTLPSFQNKLKFFLYEKGFFEKTNYLPGSTDAVRVISIKAGWNLMNEDPVLGKGFGDIQVETSKWYDKNYPEMIEADKIIPSSEWMVYGAGSGWSGLLIFLLAMVTAFLTPSKNKMTWWLIAIPAISMLLFDIGLEVQYGVFLYAFILLCGWKWLNAENI